MVAMLGHWRGGLEGLAVDDAEFAGKLGGSEDHGGFQNGGRSLGA
jgi:hypothetical protein